MEIPSEPGMVGARQEYRLLKITSELRAESADRASRYRRCSAVRGSAYDGMSLQVVYKRAVCSVLMTGDGAFLIGKFFEFSY